MKRKLLAAILGLAAVPAAFGQGHVLISNYVATPYNQVYFVGGLNQPAVNTAAVLLTVWYGEGIISDPSLLTQGPSFTVLQFGGAESYDPGAGHGPGGFYLSPDFSLPTWQAGDTFTFQVRATSLSLPVDSLLSRSALWTENSAIRPTSNPALANTFSAGVPVYVPEPSSVALAALGAVSLAIFRRRK